ncbi:TPA: hypothetical protein DGT35_00160 [Patescibacteria group bacterium]|nr:hypothetical protein [Patescibacteria group bacterium]
MNQEIKNKIANWLLNPDNPIDNKEELPNKLKKEGLENIFNEIELPLVDVLRSMEELGIKINKNEVKKLLTKYNKELKVLEKKIYKEAGEEFNINSPQQLSKILFEKLDIEPRGRATKSGLHSTRAEKLQELKEEHSIINLIIKYRESFKIKSTYLEPLFKLGDRVHTTFLQTSTATGRLSSQNPNLQNIPSVVKKVFIASSGYELVSLDYSQIELRILAGLSNDPKMLKAFKADQDIHRLTASQVFDIPLDKVTSEERNMAKTLNFGIVYGMGAVAFARSSGLSRKEARHFIEEYFSDFKKIKKWQEEVKERARKNGYVENLNGRKRWLPAITSTNKFLSSEAERAAINMPIQSLAADIIKLAMIKVHQQYKNDDVRLLLSIHDELLFEIKSDKVNSVVKKITQIMESVYNFPVHLKVDVSVGKNWADL